MYIYIYSYISNILNNAVLFEYCFPKKECVNSFSIIHTMNSFTGTLLLQFFKLKKSCVNI